MRVLPPVRKTGNREQSNDGRNHAQEEPLRDLHWDGPLLARLSSKETTSTSISILLFTSLSTTEPRVTCCHQLRRDCPATMRVTPCVTANWMRVAATSAPSSFTTSAPMLWAF